MNFYAIHYYKQFAVFLKWIWKLFGTENMNIYAALHYRQFAGFLQWIWKLFLQRIWNYSCGRTLKQRSALSIMKLLAQID